jgi:hypothetical protein
VITDSNFQNNTSNGVGMGSGAPFLGAIDIIDSTFSHNGTLGTSGSGDISLFQFWGDALIQNVTVQGGANANFGIQVAGFDASTHAVAHAIGDVVFDNVSVTGAYTKTLLYVQGYIDLDGLTFLNTGTNLNGAAGWGMAMAIDPTSDQTSPLFDDAGAAALAPDIVDLSNVTAVNNVVVAFPRAIRCSRSTVWRSQPWSTARRSPTRSPAPAARTSSSALVATIRSTVAQEPTH